jgi:organic radical activating enzyme
MFKAVWQNFLKNNLEAIYLWLYWTVKCDRIAPPGGITFLYNRLGDKMFLLYSKLRFFFTRRLSMPFLDYHVTTHCTLRCQDCNHCIPYYKTHYVASYEEFTADINNLLSAVDLIYCVQLVGGEPLLNRDLAKMLLFLKSKKRIWKVLIATNATLLPSQEVCEVARCCRKISFKVSNYSNLGLYNVKFSEVINVLSENNVSYFAYPEDHTWYPLQELYKDEQNDPAANYEFCPLLKRCHTVCAGVLYICPVAQYLDRNMVKIAADERVSIRGLNGKKLRTVLWDFYARPWFLHCKFCHFKKDQPRVPVARQLVVG